MREEPMAQWEGQVLRASLFTSCPWFAFLEECLCTHLLVCKIEASRWELGSQNGPLVPVLCLCPLLLAKCACCQPLGVTELLCRGLVPRGPVLSPGMEEPLLAW